MFSTDAEKLKWLLETDGELHLFLQSDGGVERYGDEHEKSPDVPPHEDCPDPTSPDLSSAARTQPASPPKYTTNYIGSKQKLIDWIWGNTPDGAGSAVDAFSGSSVVGYMYKTKGLTVHSVDRLRYCYHVARAIVENDGTVLGDEEIDGLIRENPNAGDFVARNFRGIYFRPGVHSVIDTIRANIEGLSGFKKDLALFALGKTCITAKGGFGHFGTSQMQDGRADSPTEFKTRFAGNCKKINGLVFHGENHCHAHHGDTRKILADISADVAYFDPPYATEFSSTNYERAYHFIEGLMTYWDGKEIQTGSKLRTYEIPTEVTRKNAAGFFTEFLQAAAQIPHWIISYRDHAFPTELEIKRIISQAGKSSRMKSRDHHYQISAKHGEASQAKERLFVCSPVESQEEAVAQVEIQDPEQSDLLIAQADHLDFLSALAAPDRNVKVTSYMGNKYFMLDFIWKNRPDGAESVLDAFSGGANTAYFFKQKGLAVTANDKLKYPYHVARAVVENGTETLSDEEIDRICKANPDAGSFIVDTFHGYFFTRQILAWLDSAYATIQGLTGYKKDLALYALGHTCVQKARFGEFSRTKKTMRGRLADESKLDTSLGNIPLSDFVGVFRKNCAKANGLVFDNGKECRATNIEALEAIGSSDADFVYADPPYITQFGSNDYEGKLHFVEGLMTCWEGKELRDNARKDYPSSTKYNRASMGELFERMIAGSSRPILISYRDKAFPTEDEVKGMMRRRFEKVTVKGVDVQYGIAKWAKEDGGKNARELLFIGSEPLSADAVEGENKERGVSQGSSSKDLQVICGDVTAACSTFLEAPLTSAAFYKTAAESSTDKRFRFVLTHVGTNRNGDHFSPEELRQAARSAIGRKIDLSHSQEFRDIVGGIVDAEYIEDGETSRVECVGELFTEASESARLAYKLMTRKIVGHVSMECDYQEGECSICGKKVKSKADYCIHLKNYKGREYRGQPVFEILHGITFTGMGLLDREGADERAQIKQVAKLANQQPGEAQMARSRAEDEGQDMGNPPAEDPPEEDKDKLIKELRAEVERLTQALEEANQKLQEQDAAAKRVERTAQAQKLLDSWEKSGRKFAGDADRNKELDRLVGLSDEAFAATSEAVAQFVGQPGHTESAGGADGHGEQEGDGSNKPQPAIAADAGVHPAASPDNKGTLQDKLTQGFMAAYEDRVGGSV